MSSSWPSGALACAVIGVVGCLYVTGFLDKSTIYSILPVVLLGVAGIMLIFRVASMNTQVDLYVVYAVYFVLILASRTICFRILFPYFISPRRLYAHLFKIDRIPWEPPSVPVIFVACYGIWIAYLLVVNFVLAKFLLLHGKPEADASMINQTALSYALKISAVILLLESFFRQRWLFAILDVALGKLPFADDIISTLPTSLIITILVMFWYTSEMLAAMK